MLLVYRGKEGPKKVTRAFIDSVYFIIIFLELNKKTMFISTLLYVKLEKTTIL